MKHGDYLLTYRYTNASVEIALGTSETQIYKIDVCKMLRMSMGRPWELGNVEYEMIDVADENGELTILLENAEVMTMLTLRLEDDGTLNIEAEWKNTSEETFRDVVLGFAVPMEKNDANRIIVPSVCYGEGYTEDGDFKCKLLSGGGFIAEEHRLPIPFVSVANSKRNEKNSVALFSIPSKCVLNTQPDNEWSMGVIKENDEIELVLLSGAVMTNGIKDCVYSGPCETKEYQRGYFDMPPGASVIKKFMIYTWDFIKGNDEVKSVVNKSREVFNPKNELNISYNDFIKYRSVALKNRFVSTETFAGYVKQLSEGGEEQHYTTLASGWTIDNIAAAWCDASNSLMMRMREGITRARQCVDFYVLSSKCKKKGLRQLYFNNENMSWQYSKDGDIVPSFEFGLMASYLADVILLFKDHCLDVPKAWTDALEDSCDFLCMMRKMTKAGTYPKHWLADGTIGEFDDTGLGVTCVSALAKQYSITGDHEYITVAAKVLLKYYDSIVLHNKFVSKRKNVQPKSVNCDKNAYVYFITAALDCYNITHDEKFIKMADVAVQFLMLYMNFTDRTLKKDSKLVKLNVSMQGLSVKSKDEHALNVFFPSYELKRIGSITGNIELKQLADLSLNAVIHLVSAGAGGYSTQAVGEQPEDFYGTNWSYSGSSEDWRGGYSEIDGLRSLTWTYKQAYKFANTNLI